MRTARPAVQELQKLPAFAVDGAKQVLQEMQAMEKEAQRVIRGSGGGAAPALADATELVLQLVQTEALSVCVCEWLVDGQPVWVRIGVYGVCVLLC